MTDDFRIEPLASWNRPATTNRKPSTFRSKYNDTLKLLTAELEHLGATGPTTIAVVCDRAEIRNDGALRAKARVRHPGVAVSAVTRHGPMTWATDRYETRYYSQGESWQANLHAIALTLGALRAVDRYGTTSTGEQYVGWRELGGAPSEPVAMTVDDASDVLRAFSDLHPNAEFIGGDTERYRRAVFVTHPDRNGGDRTDFDRVATAAAILRANGRLR